MSVDVLFQQSVSTDGYEWISGDQWNVFHGRRSEKLKAPRWIFRDPWNPSGDQTPRLLLRHKRPVSKVHSRLISPTDEDSSLFRNFASMEPTPEQILEFANRYGVLWDAMPGEPFHEWEYEVRTMRFLIEVWDAVEANRSREIAKHFPTDKAGKVVYPFEASIMGYRPFPSTELPPERLMAFCIGSSSGKPLSVARRYVIDAINHRLRAIGVRSELERVDVPIRIKIVPIHLLGALWLQFALSISERKEYQRCEACRVYFELAPDVGRADKRYCDNACRNRSLRRRQKKARDMRKSKVSLREITKATGSDMRTIKKWLAEKKG